MATATRNPTADEAVSGTWSGTASSRYTLVDDHPDSTGADFLTCSAAGAITFTGSSFSIPAAASVVSVDVLYYDEKNGTQSSATGARLKVGGTYYNASTHNPANVTWTLRTDTWTTNPKTGSTWTVAQINGTDGTNDLQAFGFNCTDASPTVDHSSIQIQVTYNNNYTLTSANGSFVETGVAAGLLHAAKLLSNPGSLFLSDAYADRNYWIQDYATPDIWTNLVKGAASNAYNLIGAVGLFNLTGVEATFKVSELLSSQSGSFTLSGKDAILTKAANKVLTADKGSYSLSGIAAGIYKSETLVGSAGAFALVGKAASFYRKFTLVGSAATYDLLLVSAPFQKTSRLVASKATFSLTGIAATPKPSRNISASAGSFTLSTIDANINQGSSLFADPGSASVSGRDASFQRSYILACSKGTVLLQGNASVLAKGTVLLSSNGSFTTVGVNAATLFSKRLVCSSGSVQFAVQSAAIKKNYLLIGSSRPFDVNGYSAKLSVGSILTAAAGQLLSSGNTAIFDYQSNANRTLRAGTGTYLVKGNTVQSFIRISTDGQIVRVILVGYRTNIPWWEGNFRPFDPRYLRRLVLGRTYNQ